MRGEGKRAVALVGRTGPDGAFPDTGLPEIALAGRSNVGKSSLINCVVGMRGVAPVSDTPGKTRDARFYRVGNEFVLVDLPGYGYARVSKTMRHAWKPLVERYLRSAATLVGVVHVVDIRHPGLPTDVQLSQWLGSLRVPRLVVATKADKVARGMKVRLARALGQCLGLSEDEVIVFSAKTGEGKDTLWRWLSSKEAT